MPSDWAKPRSNPERQSFAISLEQWLAAFNPSIPTSSSIERRAKRPSAPSAKRIRELNDRLSSSR